jgi:hypothetical protein
MARKLCMLFLAGFVGFLITPRVKVHPRMHGLIKADGGHPIPPWPPKRAESPNAVQPASMLVADGGHPIPPWPPKRAESPNAVQPASMLVADGGHPIPPWPPSAFFNV